MFNKVQKTLHAGIVFVMLLVMGWGAVSPAKAAAKIIYVKADAAGNNNGTSWTHAYTDLRAAISAAVSGDEVWVAEGTYKPTADTNRFTSFVLKSGVSIYGGFAGTETKLLHRNIGANPTILSGDIGVTGDTSDNSYHVVASNNVSSSARLDGFTIRDGNAADSGSYPFSGGGLLNRFNSSPTLTNLVFTENTAYDTGGGLANLNDGNPQLSNVKFINNTALGAGGGMYSYRGNPVFQDVIFDGNQANTGAGLFLSSDDTTISGATFNNNQAKRDGGAIATIDSSLSLTNVTFSDNTAVRSGGGVFSDYYSTLTFTNVTFSGNSAGPRAGGVSITTKSNATLINTIFWGNTATQSPEIFLNDSKAAISNSIIQDGCPSGMTCTAIITKNPQLGALDNYGGFSKTMALFDGSSAIDKGDDKNCPKTDQRGVIRPQGDHCDIGAFEAGTPGVPTLVSPPNDAQVNSLHPRLDWQPTNPDVDHYRIQVSTNNSFSAIVIDEDNVTTSLFTPSSDFDPGRRYYWRVRAINDNGDESGWSQVWSFKTPLEAPGLIAPTDGESFLVTSVSFEWSTVAKAEQYIFQISPSSTFGSLLVDTTLTKTTYTVKSLPKNQTLYWRVRAKNSLVLGIWSERWSFHTGNPPSVPVLRAPANQSVVSSYLPNFDWRNSETPANTTFQYYEIEVDDNKDFSSPAIAATTTLNDILDSDFTPLADLDSNTKYYWRVRAVNEFNGSDHTSAWSTIWSFNIRIGAPTSLTMIPNNPLRPSFEWDAASGPGVVTGYTIHISTNANFTTLIVNSTTPNPTYTMTKNLPSGKTIYWRVRANGENGSSAWSSDQFVTP